MKVSFILLFILLFLVIFKRKKEEFVYFPSEQEIVDAWNSGNYFNNLNVKDKIARNIPIKYNAKKIINLYKSKLIPISKKEKEIMRKKLTNLKKYNFVNSIPWKIAKFSGFENDYPHTHGDIIFLPPYFFNENVDESETLIHEKVHVLQRLYPEEFNNLFRSWGFHPIMKEKYHDNTRSNPDTNNTFWVWKDGSDLVAIYMKNPKSIADVEYKTIKNNRVYDINQDYYNFFGLNHNHYHVNEISAELLAQYVMNNAKNTNAVKILDKWFINNLKYK